MTDYRRSCYFCSSLRRRNWDRRRRPSWTLTSRVCCPELTAPKIGPRKSTDRLKFSCSQTLVTLSRNPQLKHTIKHASIKGTVHTHTHKEIVICPTSSCSKSVWVFFPTEHNIFRETVLGNHWLPLYFFYFHNIEVNGIHQLFGYWHSSKYHFNRSNKLIQFWNNLRVSKWWQKDNFNFWVNCPFKSTLACIT